MWIGFLGPYHLTMAGWSDIRRLIAESRGCLSTALNAAIILAGDRRQKNWREDAFPARALLSPEVEKTLLDEDEARAKDHATIGSMLGYLEPTGKVAEKKYLIVWWAKGTVDSVRLFTDAGPRVSLYVEKVDDLAAVPARCKEVQTRLPAPEKGSRLQVTFEVQVADP